MARFAVVEQPGATPATTPALVLLREVVGRLQAKVKQSTQAINRLHNLLARVFPELATITDDVAAAWVLKLLDKYPSAERIAQARLQSVQKIPYLTPELAEQVQLAAQQSVGSLRAAVAEALVRDLVDQVRHCQHAEHALRDLLGGAAGPLGHVRSSPSPDRHGYRRHRRQDRGHRSPQRRTTSSATSASFRRRTAPASQVQPLTAGHAP